MSVALTVADSKRAFHGAFPHVIAPLYRRMVDELLVELHLLSRQQGFEANDLFAVGVVQVFDAFARGYRPEAQRQPLFEALCLATGFDAARLRLQRDEAVAAIGRHRVDEVRDWIQNKGEGAPQPLAAALAAIQRPDFHYSRLMAVGLLSLLEQAEGADALDAAALRDYAHDLAAAMGLLRDRVDKDLSLYADNLKKLAQAVELMEETLAADRRRRERAVQAGAAGESAAPAAEEVVNAPAADSPTAG